MRYTASRVIPSTKKYPSFTGKGTSVCVSSANQDASRAPSITINAQKLTLKCQSPWRCSKVADAAWRVISDVTPMLTVFKKKFEQVSV